MKTEFVTVARITQNIIPLLCVLLGKDTFSLAD